jgi:hypothetical protein
MRVAEEGRDGETVEFVVTCELGAIVECDGLAEMVWQATEERNQTFGDRSCSLVGRPGGEDEPGPTLVQGEDCLALSCEEDEIGFPVAWGAAVGGILRSFGDRNAALDKACRGLSGILCVRP